MRRKLETTEIASRLKRAYFLYSHRHVHFLRHRSYLSARSNSPHIHKVFAKLADQLNDFHDPEGYIRAGFELYHTPYPNMLLSPQIKTQYHKALPVWQEELDSILKISLRYLQLQQFDLEDRRDRATLRWMIDSYHPILRLFLATEVLKSKPDPDWKEAAQYEYYLWPIGYHHHPVWSGIVYRLNKLQQLDIEENIECPELFSHHNTSITSSSSLAETSSSFNSSTTVLPQSASPQTQHCDRDS